MSSIDPKFLLNESETDNSIDSDLSEASLDTTENVEVDDTDDIDLEEALDNHMDIE